MYISIPKKNSVVRVQAKNNNLVVRAWVKKNEFSVVRAKEYYLFIKSTKYVMTAESI